MSTFSAVFVLICSLTCFSGCDLGTFESRTGDTIPSKKMGDDSGEVETKTEPKGDDKMEKGDDKMDKEVDAG